jgi:NADH-quinone oxidoreductase subunit N
MLASILLPEIILTIAACVLFLLGLSRGRAGPQAAVGIALVALIASLVCVLSQAGQLSEGSATVLADEGNHFRISAFASYIRMIALGVGVFLILIQSPTKPNGSGSDSLDYGRDAGEFLGLSLLSLSGILLVASSNDLVTLFLGIELASIPTYILVATGRPISQAQEASLKYFFLGAVSAAILLLGFAYLYGSTGTTRLIGPELVEYRAFDPETGAAIMKERPGGIAQIIAAQIGENQTTPTLTGWQMLALVLVFIALMFKLAAFPLHSYAGDVYEGSATPVTAFLSFVPKLVGIVAIIKLLHVFSGATVNFNPPEQLDRLLVALAVVTMFVGNVLALRQVSVKRMLAYSSVAHSGYLLAGIALFALRGSPMGDSSLTAVLFYIPIYGVMTTLALSVLMLLPTRQSMRVMGKNVAPPATTAETLEEIAGTGRAHPMLGLAMAVACLSLAGVPVTAGFWAKYELIVPAFTKTSPNIDTMVLGLGVIILINSAIGAAYYLRVVAAMWAQPTAEHLPQNPNTPIRGLAMGIVVLGASAIILLLGNVSQAKELLKVEARQAAAGLDGRVVLPGPKTDQQDQDVARVVESAVQ